jgi:hypothetical protein
LVFFKKWLINRNVIDGAICKPSDGKWSNRLTREPLMEALRANQMSDALFPD